MKKSNREVVAVIPAGGLGQRMKPFQTWKELIPLGYKYFRKENGTGFNVPKVISEYVIENITNAGVKNFHMIINNQKTELIRFYGNGSSYGINISYLIQDLSQNIYAMPVAIDMAYTFVKDKDVFFGMPDTVVTPDNSFETLYRHFVEADLDLALGVFPATNTSELAPVTIGRNGRILNIQDKPKYSDIYNSWNIAIWSPKFTELLHQMVNEYIENEEYKAGELLMSGIFLAAVKNGLKAKAVTFNCGMCYDIANTNKLYDFLVNKVYQTN